MISVPGKLFLFGEYSVMKGGQAVIAALNLGYQYSKSEKGSIHPQSPAAQFLRKNECTLNLASISGLGAGFGSSTAELVAANALIDSPWDSSKLLAWYRSACAPASGADLLVQNESFQHGVGVYLTNVGNAEKGGAPRTRKLDLPRNILESLYVFQAPESFKVASHENIKRSDLSSFRTQEFDALIERWIATHDPKILNEWAQKMSHEELETPFGRTVREMFEDIPGVAGVKGCGAGLNDAFVVHASPHSKLDSVARKFNLKVLGRLADHV